MRSQQLTPEEFQNLLSLEPITEDSFARSNSSLLRLLSSIDRALLDEILTEHYYQAGDVVFWEGENGDALYLIHSGQVVVFKGNFRSPTILGYRGPGEIIGEMALLEQQPRSASNIAVENLRLLRIDRKGFQKLITIKPEVGLSIMSALSARLRVADNIRASALEGGKRLVGQVTRLQSEKEHLLELQRVRQETSDLVVHDLRNPLGVIYGALNMLEMVLPEPVLEENHQLIELATTACERMQRLVDSLLDVAKLETGEMPLTLSPTELKPLLEDAVYRQSISAQSRNIVIRTHICDDLPVVLIDREKIERVLVNLLDNALKYTPNGEEVVITAEHKQNIVTLGITDNGPGIPEMERKRIFERFAQVTDDSVLKRRGFGLGLTFCRLVVEAHGGEIWVESHQDSCGSRFVFTVPAHTN